MQIKLIVSDAAIDLVAGLGSASAADQFSTLDGVTAVAMSSGELDAVVGGAKHFSVTANGVPVDPPANGAAAPLSGAFFVVGFNRPAVAAGYNGLCVALGNGTIGAVAPC